MDIWRGEAACLLVLQMEGLIGGGQIVGGQTVGGQIVGGQIKVKQYQD